MEKRIIYKYRNRRLITVVCFVFYVPLSNRPTIFSTARQNRAIPVNEFSKGSPSRILIVRRISFGMTTLPRSSILRTIPVAFIYINPPNFHFSRIFCDGNNYIVRAFGGFMQNLIFYFK